MKTKCKYCGQKFKIKETDLQKSDDFKYVYFVNCPFCYTKKEFIFHNTNEYIIHKYSIDTWNYHDNNTKITKYILGISMMILFAIMFPIILSFLTGGTVGIITNNNTKTTEIEGISNGIISIITIFLPVLIIIAIISFYIHKP